MSALDTDGEDRESQTRDTAAISKPENCNKNRVDIGNMIKQPDKTTSDLEEPKVSEKITLAAENEVASKTRMNNSTSIPKEHRLDESLTGAEKTCTKTDETSPMSTVLEEHKFNASLKEAKEHYVYFWEKDDVFSQWYTSKLTVDGNNFCCAEQYMMYMKAVLLHDDKLAKKILCCKDPRRIKSLGRQTEQFSEDLWVHNCLHVVKKGNIEKFSQNEHLKKILFNTYPRVLVEASPYDKVWGIGLSKFEPCAWNEASWEGKNLLGYIITEVRDELMCKSGIIPEKDKKVYFDNLICDLKENSFGRKHTHDRTSRRHFSDKFSKGNKAKESTSWKELHIEGKTEYKTNIQRGYPILIQEDMPGLTRGIMNMNLEQDIEEDGNERKYKDAIEQTENTGESATNNILKRGGLEINRDERVVCGEETGAYTEISKESEYDMNAYAVTIKNELESSTCMYLEKSSKENENVLAATCIMKDETKSSADMTLDHKGQKGPNKKNKNEQPRQTNTRDANCRISCTEPMSPPSRLYKPEYKSYHEKYESGSF